MRTPKELIFQRLMYSVVCSTIISKLKQLNIKTAHICLIYSVNSKKQLKSFDVKHGDLQNDRREWKF